MVGQVAELCIKNVFVFIWFVIFSMYSLVVHDYRKIWSALTQVDYAICGCCFMHGVRTLRVCFLLFFLN